MGLEDKTMEDVQADNKDQVIEDGEMLPSPTGQPKPTVSREEQLKAGEAKLAAFKAGLEGKPAVEPAPISPDESAKPEQPKKEEVPAQFKKEDGTLDEAKLDKSTQHLQDLVKSKAEKLEAYKQMQRELTQKTQQVKELSKQSPEPSKPAEPAPQSPSLTAGSLAELKNELLSLAEKDPGEALVKTILYAQKLVMDRLDAQKAEEAVVTRQESWLSKLDKHAESNPWVLDDAGLQAIKEVLNTRPYLYQGADPYGDAMAFVDKSKFAQVLPPSTSISSGGKTPILSGGRAVPPPQPSSVSDDALLKDLKAKLASGVPRNEKEAILEKMGELTKKRIQKLL